MTLAFGAYSDICQPFCNQKNKKQFALQLLETRQHRLEYLRSCSSLLIFINCSYVRMSPALLGVGGGAVSDNDEGKENYTHKDEGKEI